MNFTNGSKLLISYSFFLCILFFILFLIIKQTYLSIIFLLISITIFFNTIFLIIFFRDPERIIGYDIVACADGKIREVTKLKDIDVGECIKISTFMNFYNVHVNRIPFEGTIIKINHFFGYHLPAFNKNSEKNEKVITIISTKIGNIKIIQIAGCIARRIVPYIKVGDNLKKGDKIGIIRLGSRVDIYLPSKKIQKVFVKVGDIVKAGETTIGKIND